MIASQVQAEIEDLSRRLYELKKRVAGGASKEEIEDDELTVFNCQVGDDRVALLQSNVDEVVQFARLTPLPEAAPWVLGLLNLRGESLPVVDTLARFTRQRREATAKDFIVICSLGERRFGLVVQQVHDLAAHRREEVAPPPADLPIAPYLLGTIRREAQSILLLSLQMLLSTSDVPVVEDGIVE
jgi:purine-binding chemotaxis protein CheW